MLRWLILILLVYLVYRGIRSVVSELRGATGQGSLRHSGETTEELVACPRCGVRVPSSRLVAGESGGVCSTCQS